MSNIPEIFNLPVETSIASGDLIPIFDVSAGQIRKITQANLTAGVGVTDHGGLTGLADDDHTQYLLADGSRALSADWDAGSFEIRAQTFESDVATGTAPFTIASTTVVSNLNADTVDGYHGSALAVIAEAETITGAWGFAQNGNAANFWLFENTNSGASASSTIINAANACDIRLNAYSSGHGTFADSVHVGANNASGGFFIGGALPTSANMVLDANGNVVIGLAQLANNATNGFLYIPGTTSAAPSGTPTTFTGRHAVVFDDTNNRMYVYDGGWISLADSANFHGTNWTDLTDAGETTLHTHAASGITSGTIAAARLPAASDSDQGAIEIATQAEHVTGTDTTRAVVPGRLRYHPAACKFWVEATAGNVVETSYNVDSTADTGAGICVVTITTDFANQDWSCQCSVATSSTTVILGCNYNNKTAGAVDVKCIVEAGGATDPSASSGNASWSCAGFGTSA